MSPADGLVQRDAGQGPLPSLERTLTGNTGAKPETEAELQDLVNQLFFLADVDGSGTIQFKEFLDHHGRVHEIAAESLGRAEVLSSEEAQRLFRQADRDHNHRLDREEFFDYMHGLLNVIGIKQFKSVCEVLVKEENLRRALMAEGFDRKSSERLLEQATVANFYKEPMKEAALALLHSRADPNIADKSGTTALLHMCGKMEASFAKQLLGARCDPLRHNKDFDCPIFRAARARHMGVLTVFLQPDWSPPAEGAAFEENSPEARQQLGEDLVKQMHQWSGTQVKQMIAKRADLNYKALNGWTPLTMAVFYDRKECVEALIRIQDPLRGLKLQMQGRNARGRAALHVAARKDLPEIAKLLISNGADPDVKDVDGWTPLHHACFNGNSGMVKELLHGGANLYIRGTGGFTPYMVTKLPQKATELNDAALGLVQPSEGVDFSKRIIPILKDEQMTPLQKIEELLMLPGVHQHPDRLRLHENFFHAAKGPNKVKLKLVWTHLIMPLLPRIRSGEVDMETVPGAHLSDEGKAAHLAEVDRRRQLQTHFFRHWLLETRGPRPNSLWKFDNREAYKTELHKLVEHELDNFRDQFNLLYTKLTDEDEDGDKLVLQCFCFDLARPLLSQINTLAFPVWVEQLDVPETLEQFRLVGAAGMAGKTDAGARLELVELLTISHTLRCGRPFWRNAYRTWLLQCAQLLDHECNRKMRGIVEKFNTEHQTEARNGYRHGPVKTEERTRHKERALGLKPSADTFEGRTTASQVLDMVRGTAGCLALRMLDLFRSLDKSLDRLLLVRVINRYHPESETFCGHRFIEMNVLFRNGVRAGACGREGKSIDLALVGEVCIVLDDWLKVHRQRHLLYKLQQGFFDWAPEDEEPADEGDDFLSTLSLGGDFLNLDGE
ncbi:secG [Symbiodinium sp. CCMP2592]|nr:secG [Symbiodinium sp. CCMP2592]